MKRSVLFPVILASMLVATLGRPNEETPTVVNVLGSRRLRITAREWKQSSTTETSVTRRETQLFRRTVLGNLLEILINLLLQLMQVFGLGGLFGPTAPEPNPSTTEVPSPFIPTPMPTLFDSVEPTIDFFNSTDEEMSMAFSRGGSLRLGHHNNRHGHHREH